MKNVYKFSIFIVAISWLNNATQDIQPGTIQLIDEKTRSTPTPICLKEQKDDVMYMTVYL